LKAFGLSDPKPSGALSLMANHSQYYSTRMANHSRQDLSLSLHGAFLEASNVDLMRERIAPIPVDVDASPD
jgi:hypothetical protein